MSDARTTVSEPLRGLRTWGQIKRMIDKAVKDTDKVFLIDIGPQVNRLFINRDEAGMVEIGDSLLVVSSVGPDPTERKPKEKR